MPAAVQAASVEVAQVRELLASDRGLAGEAREARTQAPLQVVAYRKPLHVGLRRRWRRDRKLRVRVACVGLALVLIAALCFWLRARSHAALAPEVRVVERLQADQAMLARAEIVHAALHPAVTAVRNDTRASAPEAGEAGAEKLSAHRRLQRADLWLRVGTPRAANEARILLESALAELPGSVHGQVALARACLRLGDEACARTAIHKAVLARPWRAKYRALADDIDREFAGPRSAAPSFGAPP